MEGEENKMWVVTFNNDSVVRIWTSSLKLDKDVFELHKFKEAYYKRKFEIKSINEERV